MKALSAGNLVAVVVAQEAVAGVWEAVVVVREAAVDLAASRVTW